MSKKYYVIATDTFLSGWGLAKNRLNKLVIECESLNEAEIVSNNAKARSDMKDVKIMNTRPQYSITEVLENYKTKEDMPRWFEPNAWYN